MRPANDPSSWRTTSAPYSDPTCGGTRMVWYLLHGDVIQTARYHLIAVAGVPFALYALLGWTARVWFGRHWPPLRFSRWTYLAYAAVWLLYRAHAPWRGPDRRGGVLGQRRPRRVGGR